MGPETKFTILLYQYCKRNARRTHPKEGLRAFAFLISVYKTAGLGCTLGHQIMSCILPLGRGIILRFELFQGLTNALTAAQQSQIREIETAYKLLEIFQETLFICHSTHHLEMDAAIDQAAFIIKLLDCQNDRVPHMEIQV